MIFKRYVVYKNNWYCASLLFSIAFSLWPWGFIFFLDSLLVYLYSLLLWTTNFLTKKLQVWDPWYIEFFAINNFFTLPQSAIWFMFRYSTVSQSLLGSNINFTRERQQSRFWLICKQTLVWYKNEYKKLVELKCALKNKGWRGASNVKLLLECFYLICETYIFWIYTVEYHLNEINCIRNKIS